MARLGPCLAVRQTNIDGQLRRAQARHTSENWEARDRTPVETVVVTQPMRTEQGRQCREFAQETTIRIDGKPEAATTQGVACYEYSAQNPKGGWVIQK